jgi:hypothetical protein
MILLQGKEYFLKGKFLSNEKKQVRSAGAFKRQEGIKRFPNQ